MSAYALSTIFKALPPINIHRPDTSKQDHDSCSTSSIESFGCGNVLSPPASGERAAPSPPPCLGSSHASLIKTNCSIKVASIEPNYYALVLPRGSGGTATTSHGLSSPRRQSRIHGNNGFLDAIEVSLYVELPERTYTATRSLARIIELSKDLIHESLAINPDAAKDSLSPDIPADIEVLSFLYVSHSSGCLGSLRRRLDSARTSLNGWFEEVLAAIDPGDGLVLSAFLWEPLSAGTPPRSGVGGVGALDPPGGDHGGGGSRRHPGASPTPSAKAPRKKFVPLAFGFKRRRSSSSSCSSRRSSISTLESIEEDDVIFI